MKDQSLYKRLMAGLIAISGIFGVIPVLLIAGYIFIVKRHDSSLKKIAIIEIIAITVVTAIGILLNFIGRYVNAAGYFTFVSILDFMFDIAFIVFGILSFSLLGKYKRIEDNEQVTTKNTADSNE